VPSRPGTLIAGHYIGEVLRGQLARASTTTSRSTRKTCFLGRSNSFGQFTGIVWKNGEKQEQQKEEEGEEEGEKNTSRRSRKRRKWWRKGALEKGWKESVEKAEEAVEPRAID